MGGVSAGFAPKQREYLYIDGGCLRGTIKFICKKLFQNQDAYTPLIAPFSQSGLFDKIYYYDAVPGKEYNETQSAYEARVKPFHDSFAEIQALDRVHIALGRIVGKDKRQKGVDVQLAVDMMTHAFRQNIIKATLLAGDADFIPLVRALVSEGLDVTLWHPEQANAELKGAADIIRPLDLRQCLNYMSANNSKVAFQHFNIEPTVPPPNFDGFFKELRTENEQYLIGWLNGNFKIMRRLPSLYWQQLTLTTTDAPFEHALAVASELSGWHLMPLKSEIMKLLNVKSIP